MDLGAELQRPNVVSDVVKINCRRFLPQELNALDSDLIKLLIFACLILLVLQHLV